ncbi:MAG: DUF748 domain-containing protein [Usitatibacteraceae bacterium]
MTPARRWTLIILGALAILAVCFYIAYQIALSELRSRVVTALGAQSEVGEITVSFKDIVITDLKLNAPPGWPVKQALSAARVVITPDLGSLTSGLLRVNRLTIEDAYVALLRDRTGKLRVVPSLTEKPGAAGGGPGTATASSAAPVLIELIELKNSTVSFFDAEIRSPALEVKLDNVTATVTNLRMPALTGTSAIALNANVKGVTQSGTIALAGQVEFATRDGDIKVTLRDVEIAALEPYLIRAAETGVRKGTLDLDLRANIVSQRLTAPGMLTLKNLELRSSDNVASTFMGMPRDTVINLLRQRDGRIEVPFKLEGNLNDPRFALDSAFKTRLGIAAATALGVSLTGLVTEFGGLHDKEAIREKAKSALDSLKRMFGR